MVHLQLSNIFNILILLIISSWLMKTFNKSQATPYMDEIFHIPQAQNYCDGNFHYWNDKITTLPGLYLFSQMIVYPLKTFIPSFTDSVCNVFALRVTNLLFLIGFVIVMKSLHKLIHHSDDGILKRNKRNEESTDVQKETMYSSIQALILSTFPLLYFFCFLYYTDVGSTFFVITSYYLTLQKYHFISALFGIISIMFRQTNIIWVIFNAAVGILSFMINKQLFKESNNLLYDVYLFVINVLIYFVPILCIGLPYATVLLGFIAFVVINNGIVVGDRSMHEASINIPQLMYFAVFTMFFSSFMLVRYVNVKEIKDVCSKLLNKTVILFTGCVLAIMYAVVSNFTYAHKYLLADNRHYTFYIWRRIIDRNWYMRYALIPIYFTCWFIMIRELNKKVHRLWVFFFIVCTALVLIPQSLLEFRYFIIPYIVFRLHIPKSNLLELLIEACLYTLINGATFYLFVHRPFKWENEEEQQRFMW